MTKFCSPHFSQTDTELEKETAEILTAGVALERFACLLPHGLEIFIQPKVPGLPP